MPNEIIVVRPPAYTGDESPASADVRSQPAEEFRRFEDLTEKLVQTPKPVSDDD